VVSSLHGLKRPTLSRAAAINPLGTPETERPTSDRGRTFVPSGPCSHIPDGLGLELFEHRLLAKYAGMMPDALDDLTPEERRRVYEMLRLNVLAYLDETLDVSVTLTDGEELRTLGRTQRTAAYKLSGLLIRRWASGRS
jgi:hypothetical protein